MKPSQVSATRFTLCANVFQEVHRKIEATCTTDFEVTMTARALGTASTSREAADLEAKRRTYKRGRFAPTGSTRVKRTARKINRRRPRYVRGSLGKTMRVGRVGPGGEYAGVHVGAKLRTRRRGEYYGGVSASRKIATPYSAYQATQPQIPEMRTDWHTSRPGAPLGSITRPVVSWPSVRGNGS